ncbi:MAG: hypothetical protein IPO08_23015 [Xanthomonadales bacterium]|nr:hypothetical protein [Xanthomonadales bacterium]
MQPERILRVAAPHFVAGAIWRRDVAGWRCVRAAPVIKWMVGQPADEVKSYLVRKGWVFEWL